MPANSSHWRLEAVAHNLELHPTNARQPPWLSRGLRIVLKPTWGLLAALGLAVVVAAPVVAVFAFVAAPTNGLWQHLAETLLLESVTNTAMPALGVGGATH